ncbi:hypothetical protein EDB89DRAFT_1954810 [Lactarius sanguifluus]|nr:hypothetical protein EDB89DRAFT_1954810 [Lactarius sanguifluus]
MALAAARFCLATSPLLRSIFAWCMRSITSSMYCSTRCQFICVCLAPAYWVSLFPSFFTTLRGVVILWNASVVELIQDACVISRFDEYRVRSRVVKLSRTFLMPCQLTLAFWHHPRARRALSQDAIGRALCVMDAGVTQFVLDARIIGSALYQLRSTFDMP